MNEMVCISCGASGKLTNFLCSGCYSKDLIELPSKIRLSICSVCGKIRLKGKYIEQSDSALAQALSKEIKVKKCSLKSIDAELIENFILLKITVSSLGNDFVFEKELPLKIDGSSCANCTRLGGKYSEAFIQLRLKDKNKEAEKIMLQMLKNLEKTNPLASIFQAQEFKEGKNFELRSNKAAHKVAKYLKKRFSCELKISFSIVGRKEEEDIKKTT